MVSDPNIAILLIALGTLAIYAELCRPGRVVPGVIGGVALAVGLASIVSAPPEARISWPLFGVIMLPLGFLTMFLLKIAVRARRNKRLG